MPEVTVAICPPHPGEHMPEWARAVEGAVVIPSLSPDADDHRWVAHTALALPDGPVLLVAVGGACALVPAVGFAARASRRPLRGYLLVDGELPAVTDRAVEWPDAPVAVVAPAESPLVAQTRLRGWSVLGDDPLRAIAEVRELL